jgi:homoserine O-succinyltransferase
MRMIGGGPLQIEPVLIQMEDYTPKNTSADHLDAFYTTLPEVQKEGLDGLIITGAPVETLEFEEVQYWNELCRIMDWANQYVASTLFLCWGAQAGLYHYYGIKKYPLQQKCFGVFPHKHSSCPHILRGMDDVFYAPHSRHTEVRSEDIQKIDDIEILADSEEAGVLLAANSNRSFVFDFGHLEYDRDTLAKEYFRDKEKGLNPQMPKNYFPDDDPTQVPKLLWRANAEIFFRNWVNYVYQKTPYELPKVSIKNY